jgi:acyl-CoA synthetase (AMP-forming)/AMP-acid ligase II
MISAVSGRYSQALHLLAQRLQKNCRNSTHLGRYAKVMVRTNPTQERTMLKFVGLTETCTVVCSSPESDIWFGSSGSLIPGYKAKIVSPEGVEITGYDQPGELVVQSPSVVLGYLNNPKANKETFLDDTDGKGRWMRTGDEAVIRKAPSGNEHIFIVDRIKELIKVKVYPTFPYFRYKSNICIRASK